jgi:cytochrome P450
MQSDSVSKPYPPLQPDVQRKLRQELLELGLGDRLPTFADVQSEKTPCMFPYDARPREHLLSPPLIIGQTPDLEAVVHESLRCANTAGAVTRSATQDTTILGKFIPKGTTVYLPLSVIQTRAGYQVHDDQLRSESSKANKKTSPWNPNTVHQFEPSRWLVDGQFDGKAGPWMPFSLGPRGCYGRALAASLIAYMRVIHATLIFLP